MNKTPRQLWVEALRSGRFEQGRHYLCRHGNYCCLGVACEVARENGVDIEMETIPTRTGNITSFDGEFRSLGPKIKKWLGLRSPNGVYFLNDFSKSLVGDNDTNCSFAEIADIIESEPQGLFIS